MYKNNKFIKSRYKKYFEKTMFSEIENKDDLTRNFSIEDIKNAKRVDEIRESNYVTTEENNSIRSIFINNSS
jgi:hypothetical protein